MERFPNSAMVRRIWTIMEELEAWERVWRRRAAVTDSPAAAQKLLERAAGAHDVYHQLQSTLAEWRLWT